nr:MAG TPA: hypothetical protein [Crassvirales sp.]
MFFSSLFFFISKTALCSTILKFLNWLFLFHSFLYSK